MRAIHAVSFFRSLIIVIGLMTLAPIVAAQDQAAYRTRIEAIRQELNTIESEITTRAATDTVLQTTKKRVEELARSVKTILDEQAPRADAIRSRLKELGPKPDEKAPPESEDITKERIDREKSLADIDETVKLARAIIVQSDQVSTAITDQRRALFTQQLFAQTESLFSPKLWSDVVATLPNDLTALVFMTSDTIQQAVRTAGLLGGFFIFLGLLLTAIASFATRLFVLATIEKRTLFGNPTRFQACLRAMSFAVTGAVVPAIGAYIIGSAVDQAAIIPARVEPVLFAMLRGYVFLSFVMSLADGVLAPKRPEWRVLTVPNEIAFRMTRMVRDIGILIVASRIVETVNRAIASGLGLSVVTKSIFALVIALLLAYGLQALRPEPKPQDQRAIPEQRPAWTIIARIIAWGLVFGIIFGVLFGYTSLAAFLVEQMSWVTILATLVYLAIVFIRETFDQLSSPYTRLFRSIQGATGFSRASLEQLAVLLSGIAQILVIGLGVALGLAPWGVDSGDILLPLRAAVFGFSIGDVTVSFGAAFFALVVFGLGVLITRAIQRWLTGTYLPKTQLDSGLRNSITTGLGYFGYIIAAGFALSALGLGLERVTIVAGALSVGIGFGLQSIVNNFVSGLILLWERGIRVGDWIVVGAEEGYVKRINVRATEIETFDRSVVIVPNSSLVSGVVKNRVHNNRMGRVIVTIPVGRDADPDRVTAILMKCAADNSDLLDDPPPIVQFKKIGEVTKDFDLVAYVADVDFAGQVSSDLTFAIDRALRAEKIGEIPPRTVFVERTSH